jgi:predicted PurR-regulated permease PerM
VNEQSSGFRRVLRETTSAVPASWQRALYLPLIILAWLAVVVAALWLLSHLTRTLLVVGLSCVIAYAVTPLVSLLSRWLPRFLSIAVTYVAAFAILGGAIALIVNTASSQITALVAHLPTYEQQFKHIEPQIIGKLRAFGVTQAKVNQLQQQITTYLQNIGTKAATDSVGIISGVVGGLVDLVLILILSVYLTANGPKIAQRLRRETPGSQRWRTALLIAIVNQVVGGYIRGTVTLAALIGILVGAGLYALGVPYAILLGVLAFFMEFIPIIGVFISGSVSVLIALFKGWLLAIIVLVYFVFVHVIEGDLVGPRIMGKAVGIHPATALIALLAGTELFGFWGALFGAPIAGLIQAIWTATWRELRGQDPHKVIEKKVSGPSPDVVIEEKDSGSGPGTMLEKRDDSVAS